jgi:hypothetical protein
VIERTIARLALVGFVLLVPGGPTPAAVVSQPDVSALPVWMAGCWSGERAGERFHERWVIADASTLLAVAHTTKGGRMTAFEFLRVIVRNGKSVYVAQPGGAPPTEFTATTTTGDRIVFENPAHDFPKRVIYRRDGTEGLIASIDGGTDSGERTEFAMTRQRCAD